MAKKPSYEELKKRVRELEKEVVKHNRAEKNLREANRQFTTLVKAIPGAVYFKEARGRRLLVNKACEEGLFFHYGPVNLYPEMSPCFFQVGKDAVASFQMRN